MRPDFGRCVIERERRGSKNRSPKARMCGRIDEDGEYEGLAKIPMGRGEWGKIAGYFPKMGGKEFSDVLGPVKGYLQSCVGRKWDDVYSELSQGLGKFSWPLRHILEQHIHVAVDTYRGVDGKVWHNDRTGGPEIVNGYYDEFYVHPETRTLRRCLKAPRARRKKTVTPVRKWDAGKDRWLVEVNGCWFLGTYTFEKRKYVPGTGPQNKIYDVVWPDYREHEWDYDYYRFTRIKSASKKEIKSIVGKP